MPEGLLPESPRLFSLPKEFRTREAVLAFDPLASASFQAPPVEVQPVIVPFMVPSEPQVVHTTSRLPWFLLGFVLLCGGVGGVLFFFQDRIFGGTQEVPPVVVVPVVDEKPKDPLPGSDADSDGLTDIEERLYATESRNPDTDGDTFLDGNEVFHRYSPTGLSPETLRDTGTVKVLSSDALPVTILYPASWNVSSDGSLISFALEKGEKISFSLEKKDALLQVKPWVRQMGKSFTGFHELLTKQGYLGLLANNGREAYIDGGAYGIHAVYELGSALSIEYLQTFSMMLNSITLPVVEENQSVQTP